MKVEIISIGDELLIGQVVNTNASWMGAELTEKGFDVVRVSTISDNEKDIIDALHQASDRTDVILITGGLGPTNDDITKTVLCDYFDTNLKLHEPTFNRIKALFAQRGYNFSDINQQQALLPQNCVVLTNTMGTAPGMWFESEDTIYVSMPGVPYEMQAVMTEEVIPRLLKKSNSQAIFHHTVITHGVGESWLAEKIAPWEESLPENIKLAYLPHPGIVRLRLTAFGPDYSLLQKQVMDEMSKLELIIPDLIVGANEDTLESIVMELLLQQNKSLCVAESCTGGYISHILTSLAGVSQCFKGGVVAYDNMLKEGFLGVENQDLAEHGAVSKEVVTQMVRGIMNSTNSDYGIATSGITGPGGGTDEKPVGTVWIAVADTNAVVTEKFFFGGSRDRVIKQSAMKALYQLRKLLIING